MTPEFYRQFFNDLTVFDTENPIVVQYNPTMGLVFRQLHHIVAIPYISHLYFPRPKVKVGVLTPQGFANLMDGIKKLMIDQDVLEGTYSTIIKSYETEFYKTYPKIRSLGPQKFVTLKYLDFSNPILCRLYLRRVGNESYTLYKTIKYEASRSKSKKLQSEPTTT